MKKQEINVDKVQAAEKEITALIHNATATCLHAIWTQQMRNLHERCLRLANGSYVIPYNLVRKQKALIANHINNLPIKIRRTYIIDAAKILEVMTRLHNAVTTELQKKGAIKDDI